MRVRTYAPVGQTPVLQVPLTRDHLSAIGGITPQGRIFMQMQEQAYRAHHVVEFLRLLLRKVSGKLLVIWDGSPSHRAKEIKEFLAAGAAKRLHLERLPGYAASAESAGGRLELAQTSGVEKPVLLEPLSFAQCLGAGKRTPSPSQAEPSVVFSSRFGNALESYADLSKNVFDYDEIRILMRQHKQRIGNESGKCFVNLCIDYALAPHHDGTLAYH